MLELKNGLTENSLIDTRIYNISHLTSQPIDSFLEKLQRGGSRKSGTQWRLGLGILTVKAGEIDENIREVKRRRMRK